MGIVFGATAVGVVGCHKGGAAGGGAGQAGGELLVLRVCQRIHWVENYRAHPRWLRLALTIINNIRRLALKDNMITLKHDGFRKVREGITTIEEIFHIVGDTKDLAGG